MGIFFGKKKKNIIPRVIRKSVFTHIPIIKPGGRDKTPQRHPDDIKVYPLGTNSQDGKYGQGHFRDQRTVSVLVPDSIKVHEDDYSASVVERVVNIYALSLGIFNITRAIITIQEWDEPIFIQLMDTLTKEFEKNLANIRNVENLKDWVYTLHYRKTGSVQGAAKRLIRAYDYFAVNKASLISRSGKDFGPQEQRQMKENLKMLVECFLKFVVAVEMVVPADFSVEIKELAKSMRETVDTAIGKLEYYFDDVARICLTCGVRLQRLSIWKTLQVNNFSWSQQVNNTIYVITKAVKVLYHVGSKYNNDPSDGDSYRKFIALSKGLVTHIKNFKLLVQEDPPDQELSSLVVNVNQELVQEHLRAYNQGIKEVTLSLSDYTKNNIDDLTVVGSINKIITQLHTIKNVMQSGEKRLQDLMVAVGSISLSLEKFCGAIYFVLHDLGDDNEVLREQVMEVMQHSFHCCIQLQIVACVKSLQFIPINPEATMLSCLRALLLSITILIDSIDYMKTNKIIQEGTPENQVALGKHEITEAIVYILHYGRQLVKSDDEYDGSERMLPRRQLKNSQPQLSSFSSPNFPVNRLSPKINEPMMPQYLSTNISFVNDLTPEEEDRLLALDPDSYDEKNLPPGFEPPPKLPIYKKECTQEEHRIYMVARYEYETWENKLILYKIKLKKQIEEIKKKRSMGL